MKHFRLLLNCTIIFTLLIALSCKLEEDPPEPNVYGIYCETCSDGVKLDVDSYLGIDYGGGGHFVPDDETSFVDDDIDFKEGSVSKRSTINVGSHGDWAIWFVFNGLTGSNQDVKDMSVFTNGYLRFWVKCEPEIKDLLVGIRSGDVLAGNEISKVNLSDYASFKADDTWHDISIPLQHFEGADLSKIKVFFNIGSSSGETGGTEGNATFWVDNVRWER